MSIFTDVRNFAEGEVGGMGVTGLPFVGGANDIRNPGGSVDTFFRDVGGAEMMGMGILGGGEALGMPIWGGGAGATEEAAPFYGDLAPWEGGASAGGGGGGGGGGLVPGFDDEFAHQWAAGTGGAGGVGGGMGGGMSVPQMFMLGMGGLSALGGVGGLYSAYQGRQAQKKQQQQQQAYYDQLNDLMAHPERVKSLPGYQFNFEAGQDALQRKMASMGYGTSGNMAEAMVKYGQDYASAALGQQEQLLASQYGRATPPTETMPDPTSMAMRSLSSMGYGFAPFAMSGNM